MQFYVILHSVDPSSVTLAQVCLFCTANSIQIAKLNFYLLFYLELDLDLKSTSKIHAYLATIHNWKKS